MAKATQTKRTASTDYIRVVAAVIKQATARSEPDLSTRFSGVLEELGLHTVVDTKQTTRKRPDILGYLHSYEADLVLPADIVIESKKPDELAGLTLAEAATDLLWNDKTIPYIKENLSRIRYYVLTTFVDFFIVSITPDLRKAFLADKKTLAGDATLKRQFRKAGTALSLATLVENPQIGTETIAWFRAHFEPSNLNPLPLSETRNTLSVETSEELESFAETLASITAGAGNNAKEAISRSGVFSAVCHKLPGSYEELDAQTKQDLQIFTLAANPYVRLPEVQKMLRDDFLRWRDDFAAASVHSVISRLFTLKIIEDNYCLDRTKPLIDEKFWVINADDYDTSADNLGSCVRAKIQALKDSGNEVIQHLAIFGAFFDWIWLHLDSSAFDTLFRLFVSHSFSKLNHDLLGRFFEVYSQAVNRKQRRELGQYYTPLPVVRFMWHLAMHAMPEGAAEDLQTVLDPSMGSGTFLKEGAAHLAKQGGNFWQRMVGFDISAQVMGIAQANIYMSVLRELSPLEAKKVSALRLYTTDSLDPRNGRFLSEIAPLFDSEVHRSFIERSVQVSATIKQKEHFCLVIGNPPYKNNSRITQSDVAKRFPALLQTSEDAARAQHRNIRDDYAWFFAAADHYVQDRGIICFITSDSYTRKKSYELFRQELLKRYHITAFIRLGNGIFQDVSNRIGFCIIVLVKREALVPDLNTVKPKIKIPYFDLGEMVENPEANATIGTASDPRFLAMTQIIEQDQKIKYRDHVPSADYGYSLIPVDEKGFVNKVLTHSLPVSTKEGDRIFLKKWPGIITAFDEFFRADTSAKLREKVSTFFAVASTRQGTKKQRQVRVDEWAQEYSIENASDRLMSLADQILNKRLAFDGKKIKRSFTGSISNSERWMPPSEHICFVYYEPSLSIERNTNEGKAKGWGMMGQWREPESHKIQPKLVFTTSTNPKSGYKAFVFRGEWYVKLHGGTSQQFNYTGLSNPSEDQSLSGKPNNLAGGGERIYDMLSKWNLGDDALLLYIAGIYNSDLAERFIEEATSRDLQVHIPSEEQKEIVEAVIEHSRALVWLHEILLDFISDKVVKKEKLPTGFSKILLKRLGIVETVSEEKGYKPSAQYAFPDDIANKVKLAIEHEQGDLNSCVEDLYGVLV
jgi:type I restriction-modification system DNA methylase subunit